MVVLVEKYNVVYISDTLYAPIKYLYTNASPMILNRIMAARKGHCYYANDNFGSMDVNDYKLFSGGSYNVKERPLISLQDFEKHFDNGFSDKINNCYDKRAYATKFGLKAKSLELFAYDFGYELW
jgi:hypothetical protein